MEIKNALITNISLTMSDYCCLTFWVTVEGSGWGCSLGGYKIASGMLGAKIEDFKAETGNGLIAMMRIMDVVGVEKWEDLKGKYCRVKLGEWGSTVSCIGNILKDKWFDIKEFFEEKVKEKEIKDKEKEVKEKETVNNTNSCPCNTCSFWDELKHRCTDLGMQHRKDCVEYANYLSNN